MRITNIIKLKFLTIINKKSLAIISSVILILFGLFLADVFSNEGGFYKELIQEYSINAFLYIKLLSVCLSMYLYTYFLSDKIDFSIYVLFPLGLGKKNNVLINCLICSIIMLVVYLISFLGFSYIGYLNKGFFVEKEYILAFVNMYIICNVYGLICMLLMQWYKNYFVIIIGIALFILTNSLISNNMSVLSSILLLFIPNLNENALYISNVWYLLIIYLFYLCINMIYYENRDLIYN